MSKIYTLAFALLFSTSIVLASDGNETQVEISNRKDTILSDPESIVEGEKKFSSLCAYCHGSKGSGGKAKKLQGREFDPDYLFTTITNGIKRGSTNMPPWNRLSGETRWKLVAYILSLGKNNGDN